MSIDSFQYLSFEEEIPDKNKTWKNVPSSIKRKTPLYLRKLLINKQLRQETVQTHKTDRAESVNVNESTEINVAKQAENLVREMREEMLLQSPIAYAAIVHSDYCQMAISRVIHLQVDCFLIKSSFYLHF